MSAAAALLDFQLLGSGNGPAAPQLQSGRSPMATPRAFPRQQSDRGSAAGLRLRGTFIDCDVADTSLSPRAQSEPGGHVSWTPAFEWEHKYVEHLGTCYAGRPEGGTPETLTPASTTEEESNVTSSSQSAGATTPVTGAEELAPPAPPQSRARPSSSSGASEEGGSTIGASTGGPAKAGGGQCQGRGHRQAAVAAPPPPALLRGGRRAAPQPSEAEVPPGAPMAAMSLKMRLSTTEAAMEELHRRILHEMQRIAAEAAEGVQREVFAVVAALREGQHGGSAQVERAQERLVLIPTMVQNLLEARVEKAKATVRHRIRSATQEFGQTEDSHFAAHLKGVPAEVGQGAIQAVEAAVQECRAHARRQIDAVLTAMREAPHREGGIQTSRPAAEASRPSLATLPTLLSLSQNAAPWRKDPEPQQQQPQQQQPQPQPHLPPWHADGGMPSWHDGNFGNEVVADQLLRAKVLCREGERPGGTLACANNPGSKGHPSDCARPCIYFAGGECSNGRHCGFCHMPHPKRPVRLDKRHRETLRGLPFNELVNLVLPVIREKARATVVPVPTPHRLPPSALPEVLELIERLPVLAAAWEAAAGIQLQSSRRAGGGRRRGADLTGGWLDGGRTRTPTSNGRHSYAGSSVASTVSGLSVGSDDSSKPSFLGALQVMGLRSLLVMVRRAMPVDGSEEGHLLIDSVLRKLHEDGSTESAISAVSATSAAETVSSKASTATCSHEVHPRFLASSSSGAATSGGWAGPASAGGRPV